jgi:GNAT superfamily N-acetyltransferase
MIIGSDPMGATQLHWRMIGMFTLPAARGQGIAKALLARAIQYGIDEATKSGKAFVGSIAVDDDNAAALNLYKKCGFVSIIEEPWFRDRPRVALLLKYSPKPGSNEAEAERVS